MHPSPYNTYKYKYIYIYMRSPFSGCIGTLLLLISVRMYYGHWGCSLPILLQDSGMQGLSRHPTTRNPEILKPKPAHLQLAQNPASCCQEPLPPWQNFIERSLTPTLQHPSLRIGRILTSTYQTLHRIKRSLFKRTPPLDLWSTDETPQKPSILS